MKPTPENMPSLVHELITLQKSHPTLIDSAGGEVNKNENAIEIHQHQHRRWVYTGGLSVQSTLDLNNPSELVHVYQQVMLIVPLLYQTPKNILNLGYGGGAFERFFAAYNGKNEQTQAIEMTSVEANANQILLTQKHMQVPSDWPVVNTTAEQFLAANLINQQSFDLLLVDLFVGQDHAPCLHSHEFYHHASLALSHRGLISINLAPNSDVQMINLLHAAKRYFPYGMLSKVPNCGNLVMVASKTPLPSIQKLSHNIRASYQNWQLNFAKYLADFTPFG